MSHATTKSRYHSLWMCDLDLSQWAVDINTFQHYYPESIQVFQYITVGAQKAKHRHCHDSIGGIQREYGMEWQPQGIFDLGCFLMSICSLLPSLLRQWFSCWTFVCQSTSSSCVLTVNEQVVAMTQCQFWVHAKEQASSNMTYLFCLTPSLHRS